MLIVESVSMHNAGDARICRTCGLKNPPRASMCGCGARLEDEHATAAKPAHPTAARIARALSWTPLMLVCGIVLLFADCSLNNDFVAYDAKRQTFLTTLGTVLLLSAPVIAAVAFVARVVSKDG